MHKMSIFVMGTILFASGFRVVNAEGVSNIPKEVMIEHVAVTNDFIIEKGVLKKYTGTSANVTIPDSVIEIGYEAFYGNKGIQKVVIPNSVVEIGNRAFNNSSLQTVVMGTGVKTIGSYAFSGCIGLKTLTIGSNVTTIEDGAFSGCIGLQNVKIPDKVTKIGNYAFDNCKGISSLTLGKAVASIGNEAFYGANIVSLVFPSTVTSIGTSAFENNKALRNVLFNNGLEEIGYNAFRDCIALSGISIPDSVTSINDSAFNGNISLTSVKIGNGLSTVSESMFSGCEKLSSVTFGNKIAEIENYAFRNTGLVSITLPAPLQTIGYSAFENCERLKTINFNSNLKEIDGQAFYNCSSITKLAFPDSLVSIGSSAFYNAKSNASITFGNGLTELSSSVFSNNQSLKSVTIPDSVTSISASAFSGCTSLTNVHVGSGVVSISRSVFSGCDNLALLTIPGNVVEIDSTLFGYSWDPIPDHLVIRGIAGSAAETFANSLGITFHKMSDIKGISINPSKATVTVGKSFKAGAVINPANANDKKVTWSSSSPSIATVDQQGNVKAIKAGYTYIDATASNGVRGRSLVNVIDATPTSVSMNIGDATLRIGKSFTAKATVYPTNAVQKDVTYSSTNSNVATVDASGNVKTLGAGTTYIKATTANGKVGQIKVTVLPNPASVSISPKSATVKKGSSFKATAVVTPTNAVKDMKFTSSTPAVASVDANGVVKALQPGYTYISVTTHNGKSAKFLLRVI